jgi:putative SOS response-associated peptidase YedK
MANPARRKQASLRIDPADGYSTAMCGRYSITTPAEPMQRMFRFSGSLPNLPPRYNVAPTQQVPIVRRKAGARRRYMSAR